jgi:hypothetical protein
MIVRVLGAIALAVVVALSVAPVQADSVSAGGCPWKCVPASIVKPGCC